MIRCRDDPMPRCPDVPIFSALIALRIESRDITWVTDRIAIGGGIWNDQNMAELVRLGVTHIINMQIEFDDRPLAEPYPVTVLNSPTDDDFQLKPPKLFQSGVEFAL